MISGGIPEYLHNFGQKMSLQECWTNKQHIPHTFSTSLFFTYDSNRTTNYLAGVVCGSVFLYRNTARRFCPQVGFFRLEKFSGVSIVLGGSEQLAPL